MTKQQHIFLTILISIFFFASYQVNSQNDSLHKLKTNGYYFSLHKDFSKEYKGTLHSINPLIFYKNNGVIDLNYFGNSNKKKQ